MRKINPNNVRPITTHARRGNPVHAGALVAGDIIAFGDNPYEPDTVTVVRAVDKRDGRVTLTTDLPGLLSSLVRNENCTSVRLVSAV